VPPSRKPYRLTVRQGGRVVRSRFATLEEALPALRRQLDEAGARAPRETVHALVRDFAPASQVAARAALRGPGGVRAGIDLRGDGSAEAWTGRWQRLVLPREPGEDAHDALRRALG
jgi:hypothetical protein